MKNNPCLTHILYDILLDQKKNKQNKQTNKKKNKKTKNHQKEKKRMAQEGLPKFQSTYIANEVPSG